jgi:hypothetical protein
MGGIKRQRRERLRRAITFLTEDQYNAIEKLAHQREISVSAAIAEAIASYYFNTTVRIED